jgi:hypothetical protein
MPSRRSCCGPSAARGASVALPPSSAASYFLGSFGKLLTPPTPPHTQSGQLVDNVTSSECRQVKAASRDRKCVIVAAEVNQTTPQSSSCEHKRYKCVKSVRFETVQDDNRANEQIAAEARLKTAEDAVQVMAEEPLYATVRKRNNNNTSSPPEQSQRQVDMPQLPPREEGFRPYRSFRQSSSSNSSMCANSSNQMDQHSRGNSSRQHNSGHQQHTWHVRQNTEIWSSGYKVMPVRNFYYLFMLY